LSEDAEVTASGGVLYSLEAFCILCQYFFPNIPKTYKKKDSRGVRFQVHLKNFYRNGSDRPIFFSIAEVNFGSPIWW